MRGDPHGRARAATQDPTSLGLAVLRHAEEVTRNVSATCRYYGISRPTFYRWLHRYEELGEEGLRDGSSRPHHSPLATSTEVVGKIIYLREHYHFGPRKISMYLARYHDIQIGHSGVWRMLQRLDMNRLPSSQRYKRHDRRWKRYEKQLPGNRLQVDVKFIEPIGGSRKKHYQYTAMTTVEDPGPAGVPAQQPEDRDPVRGLRPREAPVRRRVHPDRQRRRVPGRLPLTRPRPRHRPRLHQAQDPTAQRQGREITPHRPRRDLSAPRWRGDRRQPAVHREAAGVGGLLQLRPTTRRPRRADSLRATTTEDQDPVVTALCQSHS